MGTQVAEQSVTEVLARFAVEGAATVSHAADVTRALIDTVGVSLGAADSQGEQILRGWAGRESSTGSATVWTSGDKASPAVAALVNGTAAHLLDYDDVSPSMPLHPSAVLLPALVAVAEERGASSRPLTEAYDVGAAAFRAVAEVLPQHVHYARGWHTTATVGRLAAVAALSRLAQATSEQTRHALGIVSSLAAGSRPNFGSMTKPLHAGVAARDAVMALALAESGFTANPDELDAANGFFDRYGDPDAAPLGPVSETLAERLEYWDDAWTRNWGLKRYPSCYGTHRGIDAMLQLRQRAGGRRPVRIEATLHPRGTRPLRTTWPSTPTEAKFSLEYALAAAFVRGPLTLRDFTPAALEDATVQALMRAASIGEAEEPPIGHATFTTGFTVVTLTFEDGSRDVARVDITHGQGSDPLTDAELHAKFFDCCEHGGYSRAEADMLLTALVGEPRSSFTSAIPHRSAP